MISIHSLRVEGDWMETGILDGQLISIHSLRVEGDALDSRPYRVLIAISIHSLRVEGDGRHRQADRCRRTFQSTPSVWRETR